MEALQQKKTAKQATLERKQQEGITFAPSINKYSRKIAQAGGIDKVKERERISAHYLP